MVFGCGDDCKQEICGEGPRVLVIGSSLGLGEELAIEYGRLRSRVAVASRSETDLEFVANNVRRAGGLDPLVVKTDVTKHEDIKYMIESVLQEYGCLERVIYNAGQAMEACLCEIENINDFRPVYEVVFMGLVYTAKILTPLLRKQYKEKGVRGKFIITSCMAGVTGIPKWSLFAAAKHAVVGFAQTLRLENEDYFDVIIVYPGLIDTQMARRMIKKDGKISDEYSDDYFNKGWFKKEVHYHSAKLTAKKYVKAIECNNENEKNECIKDEIYLNYFNKMSNVFRPWSTCISDFLNYLSTRIHVDNLADVTKVPFDLYEAIKDIERLSKYPGICGNNDPCDSPGALPKIRVLEKKIKNITCT